MGVRFIVAIIVGLLFCTLATLEFPELLNLSDDTSNDYSLAIFQGTAEGMAEKLAGLPLAAANNIRERSSEVEHVDARVSPYSSLHDAPGLHLLCIRRT